MARASTSTARKRPPAKVVRGQSGKPRARSRGRALNRRGVIALLLLAAAAMAGWEPAADWAWDRISGRGGASAAPGATVNVRFAKCASAAQGNCVIDGDTLRFGGNVVRVADIDAPEIRDYGCAAEKSRGDRATNRLLQLVNAGPFAVEPYERDTDRYGRKLRILTRNGESLGSVLVAEGLAREWDGARRGWC